MILPFVKGSVTWERSKDVILAGQHSDIFWYEFIPILPHCSHIQWGWERAPTLLLPRRQRWCHVPCCAMLCHAVRCCHAVAFLRAPRCPPKTWRKGASDLIETCHRFPTRPPCSDSYPGWLAGGWTTKRSPTIQQPGGNPGLTLWLFQLLVLLWASLSSSCFSFQADFKNINI